MAIDALKRLRDYIERAKEPLSKARIITRINKEIDKVNEEEDYNSRWQTYTYPDNESAVVDEAVRRALGGFT